MSENTNTEKAVRAAVPAAEHDDEIDLIDLGIEFLRYWWLLAIGLIAGCIIAAVYTLVFVTPQYDATSTIYIFSKSTSISSLADVQIGTQLTADFQMLATTREVMEPVSQTLGIDYDYEHMKRIVVVSNPTGTHMLKIKVTDPDPERAALISNTLADALRDQIAEIMNTDRPTMAERAVTPKKPSSPSVKKNILIGGLAFLAVAMAYVVIRFLLDDTIKTEEDVEKYLGLNVLAQIPYDREIHSKE